jgi:hypothetical protein
MVAGAQPLSVTDGMIRLPILFWLIVVSTAGFAMFAVKYEVQTLADQLAHLVKQSDEIGRDVRVLDAEWAYLNRPDALARMNQQFLSLVPIATKQLRSDLADVPMRPAPPPPSAPSAPVETVGVIASARVAATPALQASAPTQASSAQPIAPQSLPARAQPSAVQVAENTASAVAAQLDTPAASHSAKAVAAARTAPRPVLLHRPASLNELIAQITESR